MKWKALARCVRWLAELLADLRHGVLHVRVQHLRRDWNARRAMHRLVDERLAAWHAMPLKEQLGYIHPASPTKPPDWSIEKYLAAQRQRDGAH